MTTIILIHSWNGLVFLIQNKFDLIFTTLFQICIKALEFDKCVKHVVFHKLTKIQS